MVRHSAAERIYLGLAGASNMAMVSLSLRGLDYDDPSDNLLAAGTPGAFWGRRWNTWVKLRAS